MQHTDISLLLVLLASSVFILLGIGLRHRRGDKGLRPFWHRLSRVTFLMSLSLLALRTWGWTLFWIPSTSMVPSLLVGDVILVNRHAYSIQNPMTRQPIIHTGHPRRGDIAVFYPPHGEDIPYIKRIIGLPGDDIVLIGDTLIINGMEVPSTPAGTMDDERGGDVLGAPVFAEALTQTPYRVVQAATTTAPPRLGRWQVPEGHYFVLGDNRDRSEDSRVWGFVPQERLVGRADMVAWGSGVPNRAGIALRSSDKEKSW